MSEQYPVDPYAASREDPHPILEEAPPESQEKWPHPLVRYRVDGPFLQYMGTDPRTGEEAWVIVDHYPPVLCKVTEKGKTAMPPIRRDLTVAEEDLSDPRKWPRMARADGVLPKPADDDPRITLEQ